MKQHKPEEMAQILLLVLRDYHKRVAIALNEQGIDGLRTKHSPVLMHLGGYGASRIVELAEAASIKPQSMVKIVDELQALELVERCPDPADSRAKLVRFTDRGEEILQVFAGITKAIWQQYAEKIGIENMQQSMDSFNQLVSALYCDPAGC